MMQLVDVFVCVCVSLHDNLKTTCFLLVSCVDWRKSQTSSYIKVRSFLIVFIGIRRVALTGSPIPSPVTSFSSFLILLYSKNGNNEYQLHEFRN